MSGTMVGLAQKSASSTRMRGRIEAAYVLSVIAGAMLVEVVTTVVTEAMGIPAMLVRVGVVQVAAVVLIGAVGGKRLWRFGLQGAANAVTGDAPVGAVAAEAG